MSFGEGLLRARGQIAFLLALVCSTIAIIYLETLDVEGRIRTQLTGELGASGRVSASRSDGLEQAARTALNTASEPDLTDPEPVAERAAALNAVVIGISQGIGPAATHRQNADRVLTLIEDGDSHQIRALAPALVLLAAAMPEFEPRVLALLASE